MGEWMGGYLNGLMERHTDRLLFVISLFACDYLFPPSQAEYQ